LQLLIEMKMNTNECQFSQANGLNHRSRGQRPRSFPLCDYALKGQTKKLRPFWFALSGRKMFASISEGVALDYNGNRLSGEFA